MRVRYSHPPSSAWLSQPNDCQRCTVQADVFYRTCHLIRAALWTHIATGERLGIRGTRTIPTACSKPLWRIPGHPNRLAPARRATATPGTFLDKLWRHRALRALRLRPLRDVMPPCHPRPVSACQRRL